jgi:hypothetical protein
MDFFTLFFRVEREREKEPRHTQASKLALKRDMLLSHVHIRSLHPVADLFYKQIKNDSLEFCSS